MVVVIMVTLLGVVVTAAGEVSEEGRRTATVASMQAIRQAVLGGTNELSGGRSFKRDVGRLPARLQELLDVDTLPPPPSPDRDRWRGPYISAPRALFGNLDAELGIEPPAPPMWPVYGAPDDWAVLDGWNQPILIQVPDLDGNPLITTQAEIAHARLVSAGANMRIDTPRTSDYPLFSACVDDVVVYLSAADLRQ